MGRHGVLVVAGLAVIMAACTGGGAPNPPPPTPHRGGEAVFGTQFGAECLNPITYCTANTQAHYIVFQHVLPRAMQLDSRGNFVASPLLVEAPSIANGGLTQNPFKVRFSIAPQAVWDDGSPITAADFAFTWRANLDTEFRGQRSAYRADEYAHIVSVDPKDTHTAVIEFDDVYVDWPDLFGGSFDYVLKAATFPRADPEAPNLNGEMMSDIPFSGGPFRLESWTQDRTVLVRNDRYFGRQAQLDRVTFVDLLPGQDPLSALGRGMVWALAPQLFGWVSGKQEPTLPNIQIRGGDSTFFEALWFNHRTPPLDDPKVREALMYAIDRQALIDALIKPLNQRAEILNCGFVALPDVARWCRTKPFGRFNYDPGRARAILEEDGYDCSGTICAKDGSPLEVEYVVHQNAIYRERAQVLLREKATKAGFDLKLMTYSGPVNLRSFPMVQYAAEGQPDPSVTQRFACDQLSTPENRGQGTNFIGWCDPRVDVLMKESDRELIPDQRLALMEQIYQLQADDFVSLPIYVIPLVAAWRTDKIAGPIGRYLSSPYGMFFNMNEWYLAS